ncbi:hypothetical protein [Gordonia sp. (in: high G+C Gram-positive bacteria)]|uniref:hypothetical protein n=1 Tax=Gordonia sp. (in: high G+C Gram-positive bacteria) TaxID=84139 RepID=UPI0039E3D1DD
MCKNRRCIEVEHLRLLSRFENARRGVEDWPIGQCRNGHSAEFLVLRPDGRRGCSICMKEWNRRGNVKRRHRRATDQAYADHLRAQWRHGHAKRGGAPV